MANACNRKVKQNVLVLQMKYGTIVKVMLETICLNSVSVFPMKIVLTDHRRKLDVESMSLTVEMVNVSTVLESVMALMNVCLEQMNIIGKSVFGLHLCKLSAK